LASRLLAQVGERSNSQTTVFGDDDDASGSNFRADFVNHCRLFSAVKTHGPAPVKGAPAFGIAPALLRRPSLRFVTAFATDEPLQTASGPPSAQGECTTGVPSIKVPDRFRHGRRADLRPCGL
jgi:hypothetical protein